MNGDLLTGEELAAHLKVSRQTVRDWARTGRIPEIRITSKVRRFDLGEVFAALKHNAVPGQPAAVVEDADREMAGSIA